MTDAMINPATFLAPSTVSLQALLERGRYEVPDYQRDYKWQEDQVVALWDDVLATRSQAFLPSGLQVSKPLPHFFGPLVLQDYGTQSAKPLEIMDGQQRLVTFSALINVLRDRIGAIADRDSATRWSRTLDNLLGTYGTGATYTGRVTLARDNEAYMELVCLSANQSSRDVYLNGLASPRSPVVDRLADALNIFESRLTEHLAALGSTTERDNEVVLLTRSILELSLFLEMRVTEPGVAYEVFESLNARGLELEQADLLKNKLYSLADRQQTKAAATSAWERTVAAIEAQSLISLTEFLFFHFTVTVKSVRQETLYREVAKHLESPGVSAQAFASSLASTAEKFQDILDTGSQLGPTATRDVVVLRDVFRNKYAQLFVIAACVRFPFPSPEIDQVLSLAHRFTFRRFFVEGTGQAKYQKEVAEIARTFALDSHFGPAELAAAMRLKSRDANFREAFKTFSVSSNKLGFYVLEMIENHVSANAGTYVHAQSPNQHLEHILPKRPDNSWASVTKLPGYTDYLSRVGNLLILERDINSFIKNKSFAFKKSNREQKDYSHSSLNQPHSLGPFETHGQWNLASIDKRQEHLAENYALSVWSL